MAGFGETERAYPLKRGREALQAFEIEQTAGRV
jgi:hypothetical protein